MRNQILEIGDAFYRMDHDNRGKVYLINKHSEDITKKTRKFRECFKHLGFRSSKLSKKGYNNLTELGNEVRSADYTNDDCVAIVVLSKYTSKSKVDDLEVMEKFYSDKNVGLTCKPKLYFFILEKVLARYGYDELDSVSPYALPVHADQLVIHMIVDNLPAVLEEISKVITNIKDETYFMDDLLDLIGQVQHDTMTITSTLTRRLFLAPKKIKYGDKNNMILRNRNSLLLFHIREISEMAYLDDRYNKFYEENQLDDIETKLVENIMNEIPNRDRLIRELNLLTMDTNRDSNSFLSKNPMIFVNVLFIIGVISYFFWYQYSEYIDDIK